MIRRLRVTFKRLLSRFVCIPSYCKDCGGSVRDFEAPNWVWGRVWTSGPPGSGVLCYNCFADRCAAAGIDPVWRLVPHAERSHS